MDEHFTKPILCCCPATSRSTIISVDSQGELE
jgi:hypothetical protein